MPPILGTIFLVGLMASRTDGAALSDTATDLAGAVQVHSVSASAAPAAACTSVHLIVSNESSDQVQILGVFSEIATSSVLLANVGGSKPAALDSFSVPAEETVEFVRSRWFELCGLTRSLKPGEEFAAELRTPRWTMVLTVHVH